MSDYRAISTNPLSPSRAVPSRIIMPKNGAKRARKVDDRFNHSYIIYSMKSSRVIELETRLEYDRVVQLEFDPDVVEYQEKPFRLEYDDGGITKRISPDFLVNYRNGSRVVEEVKPLMQAARPEFCRRIAIEKRMLAQHGYMLRVLTELQIR